MSKKPREVKIVKLEVYTDGVTVTMEEAGELTIRSLCNTIKQTGRLAYMSTIIFSPPLPCGEDDKDKIVICDGPRCFTLADYKERTYDKNKEKEEECCKKLEEIRNIVKEV